MFAGTVLLTDSYFLVCVQYMNSDLYVNKKLIVFVLTNSLTKTDAH